MRKRRIRLKLTNGKGKLNAGDRLPSYRADIGRKGSIDTGSDNGTGIEEELQRYHDETSEGSRDNFGLVSTK